jgi:hypothetical protein
VNSDGLATARDQGVDSLSTEAKLTEERKGTILTFMLCAGIAKYLCLLLLQTIGDT